MSRTSYHNPSRPPPASPPSRPRYSTATGWSAEEGARERGKVLVLAVVDPAQPWGGVLPWPQGVVKEARLRRIPGAAVVLIDGSLVLFVDKGRRTAWTFTTARVPLVAAAETLAKHPEVLGKRRLRVDRLDGGLPREVPSGAAFLEAGWLPDHRALGAP
ncbi:MAG: hypothetical protein EA397_17425 [Deltaproteobacteria bacterium]|nr:MAG: hypothetical protein EA397_17425 [Deltaproteobacteria bacterium]